MVIADEDEGLMKGEAANDIRGEGERGTTDDEAKADGEIAADGVGVPQKTLSFTLDNQTTTTKFDGVLKEIDRLPHPVQLVALHHEGAGQQNWFALRLTWSGGVGAV